MDTETLLPKVNSGWPSQRNGFARPRSGVPLGAYSSCTWNLKVFIMLSCCSISTLVMACETSALNRAPLMKMSKRGAYWLTSTAPDGMDVSAPGRKRGDQQGRSDAESERVLQVVRVGEHSP